MCLNILRVFACFSYLGSACLFCGFFLHFVVYTVNPTALTLCAVILFLECKSLTSVIFNQGSAEPKGSASGIQGFRGTDGAQ